MSLNRNPMMKTQRMLSLHWKNSKMMNWNCYLHSHFSSENSDLILLLVLPFVLHWIWRQLSALQMLRVQQQSSFHHQALCLFSPHQVYQQQG